MNVRSSRLRYPGGPDGRWPRRPLDARLNSRLGHGKTHVFGLDPNVVHESAEDWVDVGGGVEHEETIVVDAIDPVAASHTVPEHSYARLGESVQRWECLDDDP